MKRTMIGAALGLVGCWGAPPENAARSAAPGAHWSPEVLLSVPQEVAPRDVEVAPAGDGVTLHWASAGSIPLAVTSAGLGAVTRTSGERGEVELDYGDAVRERWRPVPGGAEQSWRYERRPADGRVSVAVTLDGATLDHADDAGLWLRAPGGMRVHYTHATWVGADGVRTAIPARWVDGRVALDVPGAVVARTAFPAVLDPTVSATFSLSPSRADARPSLRVSGIWRRLVRTNTHDLLIGEVPIRDSGAGVPTVQAVTTTGAYVPGTSRGIPALVFVGHQLGALFVHAASYGAGAMVVAQTNDQRIVAARLAADGTSVDRTPIAIDTLVGSGSGLAGVACGSDTCLVTYLAGRTLRARRLSTDGRLLDATPITLGTQVDTASVVAAGGSFVVGWNDTFPGSTTDARFARVTAAGELLDPGGRQVSIAGGARSNLLLATDGTRVFASWYATASGARPAGRYVQVFGADLVAAGSFTIHADLGSYLLTAWWDGARYAMLAGSGIVRFDPSGARHDSTWLSLTPGRTGQVLGLRDGFVLFDNVRRYYYGADGAQVGGPSIEVSALAQAEVRAADFDGTRFLVAWAERDLADGAPSLLNLARMSASGALLDRPAVTRSALDLGTNQYVSGSVLLDGARAHVYSPNGDNRANHVSVDLDARTSGTPDPVAATPISLVRGGSGRLLLSRACAARLGADGRALDPLPVCFTTDPATSVGAFDGTNYAFVYRVGESYNPNPLFFRRMNADGDLVDTPPRSLAPLGSVRDTFGLAFGAGTYLLGYGVGDAIYAVRIAPDGTLGTPASLGTWPAPRTPVPHPVAVAVAFDGVNFVVAWPGGPDTVIRAARVSPAGVVLDPTPFTMMPGGDAQYLAAPPLRLASDGRGSTLFLYSALDLDLPGEQVRAVFLREDGVVVPDAGVVDAGGPRDAGTAPVDVGTPPLDGGTPPTDVVVVATDTGTPPVDAGGAADVVALDGDAPPVDVATPDAGSGDDSGAVSDAGPPPTDRGRADAPAVDVAAVDVPAFEAGVAEPDVPGVADAGAPPPPDDGGACDVGGTAGRRSPGGFAALAAFALVGFRRRSRAATALRA